MDAILDALLDNLWWPFIGGALIGAICAGTGWALNRMRGRSS